ncbi:MAG: type II secretion system F family protein [Geminicoccaceae bacterium]
MNPLVQQIIKDPNLLAAAAFVGCLLALALFGGLWILLFGGEERRMRRRIDRLQAPRAGRADDGGKPIESVRRDTQDSSIASLDRLIKRLLPNPKLLRLRLERSGWRLRIGDYLLICLTLGAVTGVVTNLVFDFALLVDALLGIAIGAGLPHLLLQRRISGRVKKFVALLPEALDLIVRGVRSGLPASEALRTIADEISEPVGGEFRQVTDQMKIGVPMDEALWTVARRLGIAEFNFLVISMAIQQETGGNLAEILEKLSDMVRRREQMRLKVKAMSSEARASAMIVGSLPFVMAAVIYFVNPGYISQLFTDPRGWVMVGIGLSSLTIGVGAMAKMIRFEI